MEKSTLFITLIMIFSHSVTRCQHLNEPHCGFDELWSPDSLSLKNIKQFNNDLKRELDKSLLIAGTRSSQITIRVVVHIVWNTPEENISDAIIASQMDILNQDFNAKNSDLYKLPNAFRQLIPNKGIFFCLATKDSNNLPTTGIVRTKTTIKSIGLTDNIFETKLGGSNNWNPDKYLNIWVAATNNYITGIASYPNSVPFYKNGVIINPRYFGKNATLKFGLGRVAVHEIGHYFGLYHTWGQQNDTICATNDDVDDTPPQLYPYLDCPKYPQYSCGVSNLFMNFMDYVNDPCMLMFTDGQMQRMFLCIEKYRRGLIGLKPHCTNLYEDNVFKCLVFPNPTVEKITIEWEIGENTEGGFIKIYNFLGQFIMQKIVPANTDHTLINMNNIANGIYCVSVNLNKKDVFFTKIVIAK